MLIAKRPEDLFQYGSEESITKMYRQLAATHHPDRGGTNEDFIKLKELYDAAIAKIKAGTPWDANGVVIWQAGKSKMKLTHMRTRAFELGNVYESNHKILYTFSKGFSDLAERAIKLYPKVLDDLGPTEKIRSTNRLVFPSPVEDACKASEPASILLNKEAEVVPLRGVLEKYGAFPQAHGVWAIGRLMHILTSLEYVEVIHGAITVDNLYVNLKEHSLHLYGGWWYATSAGEQLLALPQETIRICTTDILKDKVANKRLDWESVRHCAAEILGAKNVNQLRMDRNINAKLVSFLTVPFHAKSSQDLYMQWEKLRDQLGTRKFVNFIES